MISFQCGSDFNHVQLSSWVNLHRNTTHSNPHSLTTDGKGRINISFLLLTGTDVSYCTSRSSKCTPAAQSCHLMLKTSDADKSQQASLFSAEAPQTGACMQGSSLLSSTVAQHHMKTWLLLGIWETAFSTTGICRKVTFSNE